MYISKKILDNLGANVSINSKKNKGTTVSFELNLKKNLSFDYEKEIFQKNGENEKMNENKTFKNIEIISNELNVLIVEDNLINRKILNFYLKKILDNCFISVTENGKKGILEFISFYKKNNKVFDLSLNYFY